MRCQVTLKELSDKEKMEFMGLIVTSRLMKWRENQEKKGSTKDEKSCIQG